MSARSIRRNRDRESMRRSRRDFRTKRRAAVAVSAAIGGSALLAPTADAANFGVTSLADSGPDTLRSAVNAANAACTDDTITFSGAAASGTIRLQSPIFATISDIADPGGPSCQGAGELAIVGPETTEVTISGDTNDDNQHGPADTGLIEVGMSTVYIPWWEPRDYDDALSISNLTLTEGTATEGAAINAEASVQLANVTLTNNQSEEAVAGAGGAVLVSSVGSALTVTDSTITGNMASGKGGGLAMVGGGLYVTDTEISGNRSLTEGGGIYASVSLAEISGSTVSGNESSGRNSVEYVSTSGAGVRIQGVDPGGVGSRGSYVDIDTTDFDNNDAVAAGNGTGGGLAVDATHVAITDSTFTGNSNDVAGGFSLVAQGPYGDLAVTDVTVTGNTGFSGAGGAKAGDAQIYSSTFSNNTGAYDGAGGLEISGGALVQDTVVSGNDGGNNGPGGILSIANDVSFDLEPTIRSSTISGNVGGTGGGLRTKSPVDGDGYYLGGTTNLISSTVSGNTADDDGYGNGGEGGGIHAAGEYGIRARNSTIVDNSAAVAGGGIYSSATSGNVSRSRSLSSTVVADNSAAGSPNDLDGGFYTAYSGGGLYGGWYGDFNASHSLIETVDPDTRLTGGSNVLGVEPLLGPLADHGGPTETHRPRRGSPLLDNGIANGLANDQRGLARTVDLGSANAADGTDIGAVEVQANEPAATAGPDTTITSGPGHGARVATSSVTFGFNSSEAGSTFECRFDGGAFSSCTSPKTHSGLANGTHTFEVRALDEDENADPSPAVRTFTVATTTVTPPPDGGGDPPPDEGDDAACAEAKNKLKKAKTKLKKAKAKLRQAATTEEVASAEARVKKRKKMAKKARAKVKSFC